MNLPCTAQMVVSASLQQKNIPFLNIFYLGHVPCYGVVWNKINGANFKNRFSANTNKLPWPDKRVCLKNKYVGPIFPILSLFSPILTTMNYSALVLAPKFCFVLIFSFFTSVEMLQNLSHYTFGWSTLPPDLNIGRLFLLRSKTAILLAVKFLKIIEDDFPNLGTMAFWREHLNLHILPNFLFT